jgi:hypothetical protein
MSDHERTVEKGDRSRGSDVPAVVQLNQGLEGVDKSIREYVDERFENLDPALLAGSIPGGPRPQHAPAAASRWSRRFDVYLVAVLLLLIFIAWQVSGGPGVKPGGQAQRPPAPAEKLQSEAQRPSRATVLAGLLARYRGDLYFVALSLVAGALFWQIRELRKEVREIHSTSVDPGFLPAPADPSLSFSTVIPTEVPPSPAPEVLIDQTWRWNWWLRRGGRHLRRWRHFVLENPQRVVEWIDRLTRAQGLPPGAIAKGLEDTALAWRSAVVQGKPFGETDARRSVRALFQYHHARWAGDKAAGEKGPKRRADLRVTGQPGGVPQEAVPELVEKTFFSHRDIKRYAKLSTDDPKLQVAMMIQCITKLDR